MASLPTLFTLFIYIASLVTLTRCEFYNILEMENVQGRDSTELLMKEISLAIPFFSDDGQIRKRIDADDNELGLSALRCCRELLPLALDNLYRSLSSADGDEVLSATCAAGTSLQTCVDGFEDQPGEMYDAVKEKLEPIIHLNRATTKMMDNFKTGDYLLESKEMEFPGWLSDRDRILLQEDSVTSPDVVVAKDGSGNYRTIQEAVNKVPVNRKSRYVIYIKSGIYFETVRMESNLVNVVMFGDGMEKTIISGSRSNGTRFKTYESATFGVKGEGFMARDIQFINTAGAINHQAVALVSESDHSVFYRCSFKGYQDTLYAKSGRQFYRDCQIYGTIDFIFGDAAVVIQHSSILVRKPLPGQENTITAQGKEDPACKTGTVVQSSTIQAAEDLTGVNTFLGRPWRPFATVVFMKNEMSLLIDPRGWMPWNKTRGAPLPDKVFLAEYTNQGAGAGTNGRVNWTGVWKNLSYYKAELFTVGRFINGEAWLPAAQVPYDLGL